MPKRPVAHINEDRARSLLLDAFFSVGWAPNELHRDYGEDLIVRIFKEEKATPLAFFVQSKSVADSSSRFAKDKRSLSQKVSISHLRSWLRFREPVILAVTDIESGITYWECVQTNINCHDAVKNATPADKSYKVTIPSENTLHTSGLERIESITRSLYYAANRDLTALSALAQCLHSQYGLAIQCDTQTGLIVMPRGIFQPDDSGNPFIIAFGERGKFLNDWLRDNSTDIGTVANKGNAWRDAFEKVLKSEGAIPLLDPRTGKVIRTVRSLREYDETIGELIDRFMHEKVD